MPRPPNRPCSPTAIRSTVAAAVRRRWYEITRLTFGSSSPPHIDIPDRFHPPGPTLSTFSATVDDLDMSAVSDSHPWSFTAVVERAPNYPYPQDFPAGEFPTPESLDGPLAEGSLKPDEFERRAYFAWPRTIRLPRLSSKPRSRCRP